MTDRDEVRDQIAATIRDTTGLVAEGWSTVADCADEYALADAVMAIVDPIVEKQERADNLFLDTHRSASELLDRVLSLEDGLRQRTAERDEAQRSAHFWQSQAESWEREHQNTVLPYTSQIEDERDLAMWLHAEAVWQRDQLKIEADHQWKTRQEIGRRMLDMDTELIEKVGLGRWLVVEAIWQRDEAHAKLHHAQTYADHCAKHAAVEVLRGDVAWHLRQIVTQPPHNCADASCSIQIDPCGACCTCLGGCVHNGPDEPASERYVDVHHLVEAEIQIARLTKNSAGRPVQHDVTQVAVAVAHAFDMDLTPEAEAASRSREVRP